MEGAGAPMKAWAVGRLRLGDGAEAVLAAGALALEKRVSGRP